MEYRAFGKTGKKLSAIGIGTNRFSPNDLKDEQGLARAADLIYRAVTCGVNYIDCGHTYAMGRAEEIVCQAYQKIRQANLACYTSVKAMYAEDKTEGAVRRRIEGSLEAMGLSRADFGFCWKVNSYAEFTHILERGGVYEGLCRAKDEGLLGHICISSHASPKDTVKILETGLFEGCMVSCNILNMGIYQEVFRFASEHGIGIFTMNSLGGGVIPKREEFRNLLGEDSGLPIAQEALSTLYAQSAVTCMLTTMQNKAELEENLAPFTGGQNKGAGWQGMVHAARQGNVPSYCTKCRYCAGCPAGIPVADMMYAYSNRLFTDMMSGYGDEKSRGAGQHAAYGKEAAARLFCARFYDYDAIPKTDKNPCIQCKRCEEICTQKLPVTARLEEMYQQAARFHFSHEQRRKRLEELLNGKGYQSVGFFPAGDYTRHVLQAYQEYFGEFPFRVYVFDNNPQAWGQELLASITVSAPQRIEDIRPDCLLVSNYRYGEEICQALLENPTVQEKSIPVVKLHGEDDVAWF